MHVSEFVELVKEWIDRLSSLNYSRATIMVYGCCLRKFAAEYGHVALDALTPEHIERFVFVRKVSARTKAHELGYLRTFFGYLIKQKRLLKRNPCEGAEAPRWQPRMRPAPSYRDFEACGASVRRRKKRVLELFYFTGLRLREGMHLCVRHVDLANRRIFVVKGKGDKDRIVVFGHRLQAMLREYIGNRDPDDWLFDSPRYHGRRRSLEWLRGVFVRISRKASLPYQITAHILRHGFARLCKVRNMPLDLAAKQLGHNNILTTSRLYGQVDVSDLQEVYDRIIDPAASS